MLTRFVVTRAATSALSLACRDEITALGSRSTRGALEPRYLDTSLERYPEAIVVREAGSGSALAACMLLEEHVASEGRLVYFGPAFSRGGAYVRAFHEVVTSLCRGPGPFAVAMEIETRGVLRTLRRLLPTLSFPSTSGAPPPRSVQAMASRLLALVSHVSDFDSETMTSRQLRPMRPMPEASAAARYVVGFVPCDGTSAARAALEDELGRGVEGLERALGRREGSSRIGEGVRQGAQP